MTARSTQTGCNLKRKGLKNSPVYSVNGCCTGLPRILHYPRVLKGLSTGESLAQVASQTLDNLYVLDDAVNVPVYRPLIGYDKEETIVVARNIGTFDLSIMQVPSCCCAIPFKPATTSERSRIDRIEKELFE